MATTTRDPGTDGPERSGRSWSVGRVLAVVVTLSLLAFWAWILSGAPKRDSPDRVDDRRVVSAMSDRCRVARETVEALPPAVDSRTATERAAVVDQATTALADLVADLSARAPTSGDDGVRFRGWLREWRTYLDNRRDYAARLRTDPAARFLLDENPAGDSIDRSIKNFADVNDMPLCATPGDVG